MSSNSYSSSARGGTFGKEKLPARGKSGVYGMPEVYVST